MSRVPLQRGKFAHHKMAELTKSQLAVLARLDRDGACPSSIRNTGRYVAGVTVAALRRRGLVSMIPPTVGLPEPYYGITNAGRQALRRNMQKSRDVDIVTSERTGPE